MFLIHTTELAWFWSIEFSKTRRLPHHVCLVGWKISQDLFFVKAQRESAIYSKTRCKFHSENVIEIYFEEKIRAQGGCTAVRVYIFLILPIFRHCKTRYRVTDILLTIIP